MEKPDKIQKNPFRIPENYFDEVNRKILSAASEYKPEVRKASLYVRLMPLTRVAALISGLVLISYLLLRSPGSVDPDQDMPAVSLQEFSDKYLNEIELITLEENSALFISDDVPDVSNSDIIDYLILDNININEIYEEL